MSKAVINEHQPSMTEWFAAIGEEKESQAFREEDLKKQAKLETLYQTINLTYERPEIWPATEITEENPAFAELLKTRGKELCAFRLVPQKPGLEKIRNRGLSIQDCYETWFKNLTINREDYKVEICPHSDTLLWSTIFVVNKDMVFGEIIQGMHNQLTQGNTISTPYRFQYNYKDWVWSEDNAEAKHQMERTLAMLKVEDIQKQAELKQALNANFSHGYLVGYFETTVWEGDKIHFIDYNRLLPQFFLTPPPMNNEKQSDTTILTGTPAFAGSATGTVVIVPEDKINSVDFPEGSILVCDNTDVRYLPLMKKSAAIVTNRGGMLSHAAIVARELKIPCLVGTKTATKTLSTGMHIQVDASAGTICKA
ncbi:MAG TPA: PEP-utilizing enzyme [Patescibacteria group bacterium]